MFRSIGILIFILGATKAQYLEVDYEMCVGIEDGILFGIDNECDKYYYCVDQIAYLDDCNSYCEGCQFDTNINDCNTPEEAQCVVEVIPTDPPATLPPVTLPPTTLATTGKPTSQTTIPDITCPPDSFIFLESENCTEYYICAYGRKITMQCMEGLIWNNDEQMCDHPIYSARCSGVSTDNSNNVKCNRHGFYTTGYPLDCEKFVYCSEGIPMVQICPFGTAWHIDRCIDRKYAICQDTRRILRI